MRSSSKSCRGCGRPAQEVSTPPPGCAGPFDIAGEDVPECLVRRLRYGTIAQKVGDGRGEATDADVIMERGIQVRQVKHCLADHRRITSPHQVFELARGKAGITPGCL